MNTVLSFMIAFFFFLILSVIVTSFGLFLLRLFGFSSSSLPFSFLYSFFLGYGFLMLFLFLLGLFSYFTLFSLFLILCIFVLLSYKELLYIFSSSFRHISSFSFRSIFSQFLSKQPLHISFIWLLLAIFFLLNLVLTFFPFVEWDAVAYHLPLAQIYATTHSTSPPLYIIQAQYPQLTEVLFGIGFLFDDFIIGSFFVSFVLLFFHHFFFIFFYLFAKRLYGASVACYAFAIMYTLPEISIYITNPYIDIITAGYQFLTFSLLFFILFEEKYFYFFNSLIALAFIFAGIAAGVKYTGLFMVFLVLVVVLFKFYILPHRSSISRFFSLLVLSFSLSSFFFLPMYLKNYYYTHNPVSPFLATFFPNSIGFNSQLILAWTYYFTNPSFDKSDLLTFFFLPFYMTFTPSYFGSIYGIGPLFLLFVPLIVFVILKKNLFPPDIKKHILFFLLVFVFFLFIWYKTQPNYRLLFFGFFLLALIVAHVLIFISRRFPKLRFFVLFLFLLVLFSNLLAYFVIYRAALPVLLGEQPLEYYRYQRMSVAGVDDYINQFLPENSIILLANDVRGYYLQRQYIWGESVTNMLYIDYTEIDSPDEFYGVLKQHNITHIRITLFPQYNYTYGFYDQYFGAHITTLYSELFATHATLIYEYNHVQLYELT